MPLQIILIHPDLGRGTGLGQKQNRSSDGLLMGSLYQSVEVEKLEEPGGQTRNCGDPPSDSHLITSFVCPFKGAHSSGVIRRRPLTCVFTSGQGAAEKERGSAGQVVEDFTEHLPAEKTTGGGRRSSLPLPAATTGAASYLLVPGAPRCSQGSSTRGRGPRQTWLRPWKCR